ncbi:Uncharacterised protein [Mycobacteroides abscessus subsp. abscessus]|nr:Uncharacterised protein [Mycobacteroides abscessus subsp. abscessus]
MSTFINSRCTPGVATASRICCANPTRGSAGRFSTRVQMILLMRATAPAGSVSLDARPA